MIKPNTGNTASTDRVEKRIELNAPIARAWQALTDYKEFGQWFKVNLESPFVPGKTTRGNITYPGYEHMTLQLVVQKMEAPRFFSFTWHPYAIDPKADYSKETPTLVEFKLEKSATGTLLIVTESGFDSIPAARRAEAFRMHTNGWAEQMTNIQTYVANSP
jgi:uncharacterized protein YndB with AHSA1/START domain